jgi:hypothetical protein
MSITIDLQGIPELRTMLREFSDRRLSNAISTSLTRGAKEMAGVWQDQIDRRVDRPNPRTKSATTFQGATAATLQARVLVKDKLSGTPPSEYLAPQESGGVDTNLRKFEQALQNRGALPRGYVVVPGRGAQLDGYGNVSRSQIIAVIAQLGTNYSPGYAQVIPRTVAGRLAAMARKGIFYIAVLPDEAKAMRVSAGIYERSGAKLKAIFVFKRTRTYRKALDLQATAVREAPAVIADEFSIAVIESFARLQRTRAAG